MQFKFDLIKFCANQSCAGTPRSKLAGYSNEINLEKYKQIISKLFKHFSPDYPSVLLIIKILFYIFIKVPERHIRIKTLLILNNGKALFS